MEASLIIYDYSNDPAIISKDDGSGREYQVIVTSAGKLRLKLLDSGAGTNSSEWLSNETIFTNIIYHICFVYDSGSVTLYINGCPVELTQIDSGSGFSSFSNTNANVRFAVHSNGTNPLNGIIFQVRLYNCALTQSEIQEIMYHGIPYKYQGASQTVLTSGTLKVGKTYIIDNYVTGDDFTNVGASTNSTGEIFVATGTTPADWSNGSSLRQIGCVAQYEPSGIGHNQWIDLSGNGLHGTVNGATPFNLPANHEEIYKFTATTNTTFTLPKGYAIDSIVCKETTNHTITGLKFGFTSGGSEIVASADFAANDVASLTILQKIDTFDADDTVYVTADNWNSASLDIAVRMKRMVV